MRKLFPVIFTINRNLVGMVLHMSCVRRDASCDRFGVTGMLTNNGHGCGSHEKFPVANG